MNRGQTLKPENRVNREVYDAIRLRLRECFLAMEREQAWLFDRNPDDGLSEEIDALCRKHGFTLDHEDGQGAFILVEETEGKGGFCGASAIVPAGGDRRRPKYV